MGFNDVAFVSCPESAKTCEDEEEIFYKWPPYEYKQRGSVLLLTVALGYLLSYYHIGIDQHMLTVAPDAIGPAQVS